MNKIDDAWAILKALPEAEQEIAAEAILDYAARESIQLSEEQVDEVRRRLNDADAASITPNGLRKRILKS
jgi:hypothetical protein